MRQLAYLTVCYLTTLIFCCACSGSSGDDESNPGQDAVAWEGDSVAAVEDGELLEDGETTAKEDSVSEIASFYDMTLDLEPGLGITCDATEQVECFGDGTMCCRFVFERDITGLTNKYSFGSTHIAPAVSFAMQDTIPNPFAVLTLNFGIIIGTADKPPATPKSGTYPFSGFEPEVQVDIKNKTFSSKADGSEGQITITDWSSEEGGLWAGDYEGLIVQQTDKETKLRAYVSGQYHFILPKPQGGQPR
jgi:hypothetical protein